LRGVFATLFLHCLRRPVAHAIMPAPFRTPLPMSLLPRYYARALLAVTPLAAAQTTPATPPVQTVEVRAAAGSYDARRDDTATKIVVARDEILKHGDATLGDVLKRLPGITLGGVQGRGGEIRMRGLGSGYTQVLLNGEPTPPGFSLDTIAPETVERIEIMRGATAEYSTQAVAGTINIVLRKSAPAGKKDLKLGVLAERGYPGASAAFTQSDKAGAMSYSVAGALNATKYERPGATYSTGTAGNGALLYDRVATYGNGGRLLALSLTPRVNWTLGADTLSWQSFLTASRFDGGGAEHVSTLAGAAPAYIATDVDIDSESVTLRADLTWTRKLAGGAKLDTKAGVNFNHRDTVAPSHQVDNLGRLAIDRLIHSGNNDKGYSANGKYSTPLYEHHALVAGWDGAYSRRDEFRVQDERTTTGAPVESLDHAYDARVGRLALFVQDEWTVTPQWSVYLGLRWEGLETRSDSNAYPSVHNTSSVWSPLFQALWKLPGTKSDQLRLALTRTYKAPDTVRLIPRRFGSNNNSPSEPDLQGNPDLLPELAWGLDLAYEHYLAGGGMVGASGYVRRIADYTRNDVSFNGRRWVQMPVNDGSASVRGIELEAKLPLRSLLPSAPALELRANVARNWSSVDAVPGPDNRLDQQTPVSASLGIDYKAGHLPLSIGGSLGYQGGGPVRIAPRLYAVGATKRTLDLYAVWKLDPKNQLRFAVANALHQQNVSESAYIDAQAALRDRSVTPTAAVARVTLESSY
jgi:outer membrane receptor for ferrienterochelin and colicins